MTSNRTTRILIAGAGLGGLTLVRALHNFAATIDVVERSSAFEPVGVGIVLHPNGMNVMDQLGMAREVRAAGHVVRQMELVRGDSRLILPLKEIWEGATHPTVSILRPALHEVLANSVFSPMNANISLQMKRRVTAIVNFEHRPQALFDDQTTGTYDLIVGADGVHSAIRQSLLPDSAAVSTNLLYFRFPARNVIGLSPDTWLTVERDNASYGFIPLAGDQLHCFVQLRTPERPYERGQEEQYFEREFCSWDPKLRHTFDARCAAPHVGFAYMVRPFSWGKGACVLLGDAAHAISPTLSEGGSLAMEDALVLSLALKRSKSISEAVDIYRSTRQDRVMWAYRMSLSQVNSLRRQRRQIQTDSIVAARHMRQMYAPLRADPIPQSLSTTPGC